MWMRTGCWRAFTFARSGDLSAGDVQKETLEKAIEQFQEILKIQPDDAYSELWLARLYRFENKHSEAEKVLRDLLQRDPSNGPGARTTEPTADGRRPFARSGEDPVGRSRAIPLHRKFTICWATRIRKRRSTRKPRTPTAKQWRKIRTIRAICMVWRKR